jgi:hypothetical protein
MRPDIAAGLAAVTRRLHAAAALRSIGTGSIAAALALAIARLGSASSSIAIGVATIAGIAVTAAVFARSRSGRSLAAAAAAIERARPECRNVVVTAEELQRHPDRAAPWIRRRVEADAEQHVAAVPAASAVTLRTPLMLALAGIAALLIVATNVPRRVADAGGRLAADVVRAVRGADPDGTLIATIDPPAHTRLQRRELRNPAAIEAVEGSRLTLRAAGAWRLRFGTTPLPTSMMGGATMASTDLRQSGYVAIEPPGESASRDRRLVPVTVTPDRAPVIRVGAPGRDLLLPDNSSAVNVEASASDDFALAALSLRYTRVSGSGEQFEFVEGELPIQLSRADEKHWQARGTFSLPALGLEPGDSLVYRVVARDGRAGEAGLSTSDTYYIEVAGPGQVPLEGFEMPPDRERYALSQQMIVLKIQRLRARERSLARDTLVDQTAAIAAEQRAVRANFVFLMGGHIEDEEEEAAHEHEVQEGRLENTARREISRAVSHMTFAEQGLTAVDTARALEQAKLAVDALQRAFGRNRYLLRALPVRSRIDPSRRLTGKLDDASTWAVLLAPPLADKEAEAARELLIRLVASVAPAVEAGNAKVAVEHLIPLAELALQVNPSEPAWIDVSAKLQALRGALNDGRPRTDVEPMLADAVQRIVAQLRKRMPDLPPGGAAPGRLRSAWTEAQKTR